MRECARITSTGCERWTSRRTAAKFCSTAIQQKASATALFVVKIRAAEWINVSFSGREHRFRLEGSVKELDALHPLLEQACGGSMGL